MNYRPQMLPTHKRRGLWGGGGGMCIPHDCYYHGFDHQMHDLVQWGGGGGVVFGAEEI
jgi:hypothetical protein